MAGKLTYLEWVYVGLIGAQLVGMFLLDFVFLYPTALLQDPSAPLHFLIKFRQLYFSITGDPFVALPSKHLWFDGLAILELFTQLPLGAYFIYRLTTSSGSGSNSSKTGSSTDGPTELAGLAFGCLNTMGSFLATLEIWCMAPESFLPGQQTKLIFTEFGPYYVLSAALAVDMYLRLLRRFEDSAKAIKAH